ncbi:unnamed protein product, partial [Nesidiocoris tenuis]
VQNHQRLQFFSRDSRRCRRAGFDSGEWEIRIHPVDHHGELFGAGGSLENVLRRVNAVQYIIRFSGVLGHSQTDREQRCRPGEAKAGNRIASKSTARAAKSHQAAVRVRQ